MEEFITVSDFAVRLGVPIQTVYAWIRQNIIPSIRHGGRIFIKECDVPDIEGRYKIHQNFKIKK